MEIHQSEKVGNDIAFGKLGDLANVGGNNASERCHDYKCDDGAS